MLVRQLNRMGFITTGAALFSPEKKATFKPVKGPLRCLYTRGQFSPRECGHQALWAPGCKITGFAWKQFSRLAGCSQSAEAAGGGAPPDYKDSPLHINTVLSGGY